LDIQVMTINSRPPGASTGAPGEPGPDRVRRTALTAIAAGITPACLREQGPETASETLRLAVAAEIEELTARGVTQRAASRVIRERDRVDPCGGKFDEHGARQVARIYLTRSTPDEIRSGPALEGTPKHRRMFRMIADAMDALLAEGFDPAAVAESVKSTEED
jgi:hypothetical protein